MKRIIILLLIITVFTSCENIKKKISAHWTIIQIDGFFNIANSGITFRKDGTCELPYQNINELGSLNYYGIWKLIKKMMFIFRN
ncbi:MAG: hypothetical protein HC905_21575 [Bacteroidales bacterium]|nr:hypothetical protein [Bacteroidales bacterium]